MLDLKLKANHSGKTFSLGIHTSRLKLLCRLELIIYTHKTEVQVVLMSHEEGKGLPK